MNKKMTILYERLSRDDGEDATSNSIQNQRRFLEDYAERNNLKPYKHIQEAAVIIEPTRKTLINQGVSEFGSFLL
jgi:hypothetical protein